MKVVALCQSGLGTTSAFASGVEVVKEELIPECFQSSIDAGSVEDCPGDAALKARIGEALDAYANRSENWIGVSGARSHREGARKTNRDAECALRLETYQVGTIRSVAVAICHLKMSTNRAVKLGKETGELS